MWPNEIKAIFQNAGSLKDVEEISAIRNFDRILNSDNVDDLSNLELSEIKSILSLRFTYEEVQSWSHEPPLENLTLLGWCAILDLDNLAKLLLQKGSDCCKQLNDERWTALHIATVCRSHKVMKEIANSSKCEIDATIEGPLSALFLAIELDDLEGFQIVMKFKPSLTVGKKIKQKYALIEAINANAECCFQEMLSLPDVDINQSTKRSFPLLAAAFNNRNSMAQLLIHKNVEVNKELKNLTTLAVAASNGNLDLVKMLVKAGADINHISEEYSKCALAEAISNGSVEVVKFLLANGAQSNVTTLCGDDEERDLLSFSIYIEADDEIINSLINSITDFEITEELIKQCVGSDKAAILDVLSSKSKTSIKDNIKNKWIINCAEKGKLEILKIFVEKLQGERNAENEAHRTPIMLAALNGHLDIVKYLINWSDVNMKHKDIYGNTPLHYICASMDEDLIDLVREYNDECISAKNKRGHTPLHYSRSETLYRTIIKMYEAPKLIKPSDMPIPLSKNISLEFIESMCKFPNTAEIMLDNCYQGIGFGIADPQFKIKVNTTLFQNDSIKHIVNKQEMLLRHPVTRLYLHNQEKGLTKFLRCYAFLCFLIFAMLYSHLMYFLIPSYLTKSEIRLQDAKIEFWVLLVNLHLVLLYFIISIKCSWYGIIFYAYWLLALFSKFTSSIDWWALNTIGMMLAWLNFAMIFRSTSGIGLYVVMFLRVLSTFLKLIIPLFLFIFAFALSFFCLNARLNTDTYLTLSSSLFKCLSLMIGSVDPDEVILGKARSYDYAFSFVMLTFVAFVTIIATNLVIGLIVSDVQAVKDEAILNMLKIKANESIVSNTLLKPLKMLNIINHEFNPIVICPNERHQSKYLKLISRFYNSNSDMDEIINDLIDGIKQNFQE